jgi:prolipoprotein diacylglyceryl transferase
MEHFVWNIDPVLLHLGPLQLRWYGLLFVGSFFLGLSLLQWVYKRENKDPAVLEHLLIYVMVGAVVGSRLMHCFAYEPHFYLSHPLEIFKVWKGGLASHGGLLGVLVALYLFSRRYNQPYLWLLARISMAGALTASFVRFGNFFNSEILGLPTQQPWGIIFSRIDMLPRHPVQLYEAFSYLLLFVLLVWLYTKLSAKATTRLFPPLFLTVMFSVRFALEFTKTKQADYTWSLPITTGQALSLPFIAMGLIWLFFAIRQLKKEA